MVTGEALSRNAAEAEKVRATGLVGSVVRLFPTFALLAIVGTLIGLLLRIPLNDLGAVVGVPMTIVFLLSRVAVIAVPHSTDSQSTETEQRSVTITLSPMFICGMFALMIGVLASIVLAISAEGYRVIGLGNYFAPTLHLSLIALALAVTGVLLLLLEHFIDHHAASAFLRAASLLELDLFWRLMRAPTRIARFCLDK